MLKIIIMKRIIRNILARKKTVIAIFLAIILTLAVLMGIYVLLKERTFQIAVISDIHLGTTLCDWKQCGSKIEDAFREVLDKTDDMLVISVGDNADASEFHEDPEKATSLRGTYKARLLELAGGRTILWANGNHDQDNYVSSKEYYSFDKNNWRFIVIHTTSVEGEQYDWLVNQLKTDKKIIVVMHHPIFQNKSKHILSRYNKIVKLFSEKNVQYVLSGHWHADNYEREYGGVIYKAIPGLTYHYKTNYKIMDLNYKIIETWNLPPFIRKLVARF